jgi:CRISPR-associated endonuclease/helicase Cas3
VLVIDEVHSYDIFMSQYLHQLLWWCGDGRIPVILMSATLPPAQRQELVAAYAQGGDPRGGTSRRSPVRTRR